MIAIQSWSSARGLCKCQAFVRLRYSTRTSLDTDQTGKSLLFLERPLSSVVNSTWGRDPPSQGQVSVVLTEVNGCSERRRSSSAKLRFHRSRDRKSAQLATLTTLYRRSRGRLPAAARAREHERRHGHSPVETRRSLARSPRQRGIASLACGNRVDLVFRNRRRVGQRVGRTSFGREARQCENYA